MPKSNFEINKFNVGIVSNPEDERDIPIEAASFSLNIDPTVNGQLAGIKNDKVLKRTGFDNNIILTDYDQGSRHQVQQQGHEMAPPPGGGEGGGN
jgi:hypothetical protein|tara:strand:+ start:164 stop:448 length:285 start_codon:yes stop_codon:yes gene_type:complete